MNPDQQPFTRGCFGRSGGASPEARWKISGSLYIECPTCGFEPAEQMEIPRHACPKCLSDTWRRRLRPGQPDQYADAS